MKPEEFLSKLNRLPEPSQGSFSTAVLSLSKLGAAEVIPQMFKNPNFAVKVNALKAIRKHQLTIYERDIMQCLLDTSLEVKIAAIKTLASFGDFNHFPLVKAFYDEEPVVRTSIIDSFSNYSDRREVYPFIFGQLANEDEKIQNHAVEWFNKAFGHALLVPWIADAYKANSFSAKRAFEKTFVSKLPLLFTDPDIGYRLKLCYLVEKRHHESH